MQAAVGQETADAGQDLLANSDRGAQIDGNHALIVSDNDTMSRRFQDEVVNPGRQGICAFSRPSWSLSFRPSSRFSRRPFLRDRPSIWASPCHQVLLPPGWLR